MEDAHTQIQGFNIVKEDVINMNEKNNSNNLEKSPIIVKGNRVRKFEKLAEDMITNDWGMTLELKIKRRIKRDHGEDDYYLNIASSGGRWFITVPLYMWDSLKKKVDAMVLKVGDPHAK